LYKTPKEAFLNKTVRLVEESNILGRYDKIKTLSLLEYRFVLNALAIVKFTSVTRCVINEAVTGLTGWFLFL